MCDLKKASLCIFSSRSPSFPSYIHMRMDGCFSLSNLYSIGLGTLTCRTLRLRAACVASTWSTSTLLEVFLFLLPLFSDSRAVLLSLSVSLLGVGWRSPHYLCTGFPFEIQHSSSSSCSLHATSSPRPHPPRDLFRVNTGSILLAPAPVRTQG